MIYFTSDTHFWHTAMVLYFRKQYNFRDREQMNEVLIEKWNSRIGKEDEVYFLGDFAFCGRDKAIDILEQLNGIKYWLRGNHDRELAKKDGVSVFFEWVKDYYVLRVHDKVIHLNGNETQFHQPIILCHFPFMSWENMHYGAWHLHGHCHGSLPDNPNMKRLDVGVDTNDLLPYSYEDVKAILKDRQFKPVDHHG